MNKIKIGNIELENNIILAPLAGYTNRAYREIMKEMGCGLVTSEMVSAKGLVYENDKTFEYIISQLPDYFMLVNKNQIVNLKEVYNVQGNELYLKKLKSSFIISDAKKEEFEQRWSQLALSDNTK